MLRTMMSICFYLSFHWIKFVDTLPETGDLPSAKIFTECIPSGTRQKSCLSSAVETTLGKIMALGIPNSLPSAEKRPLGKLGKNTRQNRDTRQKTATWTSVS